MTVSPSTEDQPIPERRWSRHGSAAPSAEQSQHREAENVADMFSSSQSNAGYVRNKLKSLRQVSSEGICRPVPDEVPVSTGPELPAKSCPSVIVTGDSD